MLLTLLASLLLCSTSADEQQAASALQSALFGGSAVQPVAVAALVQSADDSPVQSLSVQSHSSGQVLAATASRSSMRKASSKSYSFQDLSQMRVQSAPKQTNSFYRPGWGERLPVVEECQAVQCHLALVLILDSSGSVGFRNFEITLSFVQTLLEILTVKADEAGLVVCTGIVRYSSGVEAVVDPCCRNSMCRVVEQFSGDHVDYQAGSTNTNGALKVARQMLQAPASYKKVAILITDGHSNTGGSPIAFAKQMRLDDDISIVALGVTDSVNEHELRGISGMDFVTKIDYFDDFHEMANLLLEANYMDESELVITFESICSADSSAVFAQTCSRDIMDSEDLCGWGGWSTCVQKKNGKCITQRTCKIGSLVVKTEKHDCECPEVQALASSQRLASTSHRQKIQALPYQPRHSYRGQA